MSTLPPPVRLRAVALLKAHAKVKRTEKARPTPQQARERPRYRVLAVRIAAQEAKVARVYARLRRDWLKVIERQPEKALGAKNLNVEDTRAIDAAIERFMAEMAGPRPRDRQTFAVSDDALVQETNILSHRVGAARGAEQAGNATPNTDLTRLQKMHLNERAFERLSEDGRLRFETRLGDIKARMLTMFDAGENPLKIARELGKGLDGYHKGRLRQIVRTEAAFASEAAIVEQYRAAGVRQFIVEGDPSTDALCVGYQDGGPYDLGNEDARPPYHPHCFCSQSPYTE